MSACGADSEFYAIHNNNGAQIRAESVPMRVAELLDQYRHESYASSTLDYGTPE
jgi:hypothetical protein